MTDIPTWLKFQRSRTPTLAAFRAERDCVSANTVDADIEISQPSTSKASFRPGPNLDAHLSLNDVDEIWYNPDPDQMAETLKVFMMARGSFHPVPVKFNSCILHILETYQDMRHQLTKRDEEIQIIKQAYETKVKNYEREILQWKEIIGTNSPEIKGTVRAWESNLPASSNALETTGLEIDGYAEYSSNEHNIYEHSQALNNGHGTTSTVMENFRKWAPYKSLRERQYATTSDIAAVSTQASRSRAPNTSHGMPSLAKKTAHVDHKQPQSPRSSSASANDLAPDTKNLPAHCLYTSHGMPIRNTGEAQPSAIDSKHCPEAPSSQADMTSESALEVVRESTAHYKDEVVSESVTNNRFSFLPGDDNAILLANKTEKKIIDATPQRYTDGNGKKSDGPGSPASEGNRPATKTKVSNRTKEASKTEGKPGPSKPRGPSKDTQPTREDSQSSIITIIRDDFSQSNKSQEFSNKDVLERARIGHRNENHEAIIAAIHAVSGTERDSTNMPKNERTAVECSHIGKRKPNVK